MIVEPPGVAVTVPVHVPPIFAGFFTNTFAGRVSTSAEVKVAAVAFVFPNVIVSVLVPPTPIVSGLKTFPTVGKAAVTVRSSDAVPLSGASLLATTLVVFV